VSPRSLLIGAPAALAIFGAFIRFAAPRRGFHVTVPELLTGLLGVYLGLWAAVERTNWLDLPALILITTSAIMQVVWVRRCGADGTVGRSADRLTGVRLAPLAVQPAAPAGGTRRWIGTATMSGRLGLITVTVPLACLTLDGSTISLRLRPRLLQRILGVTTLSASQADGVEAFPVRKPRDEKGIEIVMPHGAWCYLGTRTREEVLAALAEAGFTVSWLERQAPL
jgi:hypothetical protein